LVSAAFTEPSLAMSKPVTSTPVISFAPVDSAFACMPATESRLCAKPPLCSCRTAVTPFARQSGNSFFMYASHSASPVTNVES
jgi:hypothetical protein